MDLVSSTTQQVTNSISTVESQNANIEGEETKENRLNAANCDSFKSHSMNEHDQFDVDSDSHDKLNKTIESNHNSDVDSDESLPNLQNKIDKPKRKRLAIVDSDSDEDSKRLNNDVNIATEAEHSTASNSDNDSLSILKHNRPLRKRLTIVNSDSEEESDVIDNVTLPFNQNRLVGDINSDRDLDTLQETSIKNTNRGSERHFATVDSDSEKQVDLYDDNIRTNHSSNSDRNRKLKDVVEFDVENYNNVVSRVAALCDDDDSDDTSEFNNTRGDDYTNSMETQPSVSKSKKPTQKTSAKKNIQKPVEKKMTAKQALEQRQEIRSASQKRVREMPISLPYHKPKAHSIKEFLQNRPRLSLSLTKDSIQTSPALALKMSTKELEAVTKKLEEREKVVQQFYMSESDFEDEKENNLEDGKNSCAEISQEEVTVENLDSIQKDSDIVPEQEVHIVTNTNIDLTNENVISENDPVTNYDAGTTEEHNSVNDVDKQQNVLISNQNENAELQMDDIQTLEMSITSDEVESGDLARCNENEELTMEVDIETSSIINDVQQQERADLNNSLSSIDMSKNDMEETTTNCESNLVLNETQSSISKDLPIENSVHSEQDLQQPVSTVLNTTNQGQSVIFIPTCDVIQSNVNISYDTDGKDTKSDTHLNSFTENCDDWDDVDFNLDELEVIPTQITEPNVEEDHLQRLLKKYSTASDTNNQLKSSNRLELLKQNLGDFQPRLSGGPNEVIDLDKDITTPTEISLLVKRFMKHNAINKPKQKVELDVINLTQGEIRHEKIAMSVDPEQEPSSATEIPGDKFRKLKQKLQAQIAQQKSELWQHRLQPDKSKDIDETVNKDLDEKSDCGANDDAILDDEEEAELTDEEAELTDEEAESINEDAAVSDADDDDVEAPEEKQCTSEFIDGEAEETDADDEYEEDGEDKEDDEDKEDKERDFEQESANTDTTFERPPVKRQLRRILKGFCEDSDEEDGASIPITKAISNISNSLGVDTYVDDDEPISPNKPRIEVTPQKSPEPDLDIVSLTPIMHSAGLNLSISSGSKFLQESPALPLISLQDNVQHLGPQRKLFPSISDTSDTQSNIRFETLCSGTFSKAGEGIATTQELLNICSGSFPDTGVDQPVTKNTQNTTVTYPEKPPSPEIKTLNEDKLISELLDEEEMEQFKKKFESPNEPHLNPIFPVQNDSDEEIQEVQGGGFIASDSSDDENVGLKNTSAKTKKLKKKLAFSDDESSDGEDGNNTDDEINLQDNQSDEEDDDENNVVDYDSEENEIELEASVPNVKLADFLENEAELSESEWGSADEDERGLDILETEQGDADVFDENKIRSDLEKIHMRRVLDQDNQEIKMLQELLLEDGELHGTGRQRQFRWSNIDNEGDDAPTSGTNLDIYFDEEESEEQWRKARHQREMFLKKNQDKLSGIEEDDLISSESNSQIIKLGQEAVRKSLSSTTIVPDKTRCLPASPQVSKQPLLFMSTRGSFLARTEKVLTRLAEFTKVTTETVVKTSKNPKNFVFQRLATEDLKSDTNDKKRKITEKNSSINKKLRFSTDNISSTSVNRKKKWF